MTYLKSLSSKPVLIALFVICALPAAGLMAIHTPPSQVPDEPAHMARADGLLHGAVLSARKFVFVKKTGRLTLETGVKVNAGLMQLTRAGLDDRFNRQNFTPAGAAALWRITYDGSRVFSNIPNTATYFPTAYVPAALGLEAGLLLHQSAYRCLMIARFAMLAAFLLLGGLAIYLAAYGEALIIGTLLLPMTLFLAGSINQDGVIIALACVAAAALTRDATEYPKSRLFALAALVLVLLAKAPYLPLLGLALLPFGAAGRRRRARQVLLAAIPVLLWAGIVAAFVAAPFGHTPYHPGPLFTGDPARLFYGTDAGANLHILLAKPSRLITMPVQMAALGGWEILRGTIGILGLLALQFPDGYYQLWAAALAAAWLGATAAPRAASHPTTLYEAGYAAVLILAACWIIVISMYPGWTLVGAPVIEGFQGRYLLVPLPFLLFAIPRFRTRLAMPAIVPALPGFALGLYDLHYLPLRVMQTFGGQ